MNSSSKAEPLRPVISADQIQKRVREMARQISMTTGQDHSCAAVTGE